MKKPTTALDLVLRQNPDVVAAYFDTKTNPSTLVVLARHAVRFPLPEIPVALSGHKLNLRHVPPLKILRCPVTQTEATNEHQKCQDEPILLGTQIQPTGANWLGTAGSPVKWAGRDGNPHWGLLTNWHVLADGDERVGRPCHQPTTARKRIGTLALWSGPHQDSQTLVDAAIADAFVDGAHTVSNSILGIGVIGTSPLDASVGLPVQKSGRTTGVTRGRCTAVGASVRVGYGDFDAILSDQDIYAADAGEFSAAGDSGSLIVEQDTNRPVSLLFAGGGALTIGNAIRHVTAAFNLVFPFN